MKVKVTYEQLILFRSNAESYLRMHPGKFSPFLYSLTKMIQRTSEDFAKYGEEVKELNQNYCERDKEGFFKLDNIGQPNESYKITAENTKKRDKDVRDLQKREIEIEPHISKEAQNGIYPEDIGFAAWQYFAPFVLPEIDEELELKLYELQAERDNHNLVEK